MKNLILLLLVLIIASCSNELVDEMNSSTPESSVVTDINYDLKKKFGIALAKVLSESHDVRTLIKNEALKKIDYDYDVLYQLVKNNTLSDGSTLEKKLLKYMDASELALIVEQIPTLTIFVPELPKNAFSAELWKTDSQIPFVAICTNSISDSTPIIDPDGYDFLFSKEYVPQFPVVVVKENERIVSNKKNNLLKSTFYSNLKSVDGLNTEFIFIDECFDNSNPKPLLKAGRGEVPLAAPKTVDAFNIYYGNNGWQRDYIYYGIKPDQQRGAYLKNFKEHLVRFKMNVDSRGDGTAAFNKISQSGQGDPTTTILGADKSGRPARYSFTEGEFEFRVKIYFGTKSPTGNELILSFRASAGELFSIVYSGQNGAFDYNGSRRSIDYEKIDHLNCYEIKPNLPLFAWNLENYSVEYKISIEEVDPSTTTVVSSSTTSEYATNFSFEPSIGEKVKIGMKYGASNKETVQTSFSKTTSNGNNELGEVIVNFGEDVLLGLNSNGSPIYQSYKTGWYTLSVEPKIMGQ